MAQNFRGVTPWFVLVSLAIIVFFSIRPLAETLRAIRADPSAPIDFGSFFIPIIFLAGMVVILLLIAISDRRLGNLIGFVQSARPGSIVFAVVGSTPSALKWRLTYSVFSNERLAVSVGAAGLEVWLNRSHDQPSFTAPLADIRTVEVAPAVPGRGVEPIVVDVAGRRYMLLPVIRGWFEFVPADRGDVRRLCGEINTILR